MSNQAIPARIIFADEKHKPIVMLAPEFEKASAAYPVLFQNARFEHPVTKAELKYKSGSDGRAASFSHLKGQSSKVNEFVSSWQQAAEAGYRIVARVNADLNWPDETYNFSNDNSPYVVSAKDYKTFRTHYETSVSSVSELENIKQRFDKEDYKNRFLVSYGSAISPFANVLTSGRNFNDLYSGMLNDKNKIGVCAKGGTRQVAFPCVFEFNLAGTEREEIAGNKGAVDKALIFSKPILGKGKNVILNELVFSGTNIDKQHEKSREMQEEFIQSARGSSMRVIGVPRISVGEHKDGGPLKIIRWVINNPSQQICMVNGSDSTPFQHGLRFGQVA